MKIKILFEKEKIDDRFDAGWGMSYLVGDNVLFDAGEKFEYLRKNAGLMGVDLGKINKVVISHDHWDHVSGLWGILDFNKGAVVYGCGKFKAEFKEKVKSAGGIFKEVKETTEIEKDIYVTAELLANYKGEAVSEHFLAIRSAGGMVLVCGCCHAGVLNILQRSASFFNCRVDYIIGGLHLMDKEKRFMEYIAHEMPVLVKKVAAGHCTGYDAVVLLGSLYKENFIELKAGMELDI